MRVLVIAVVVVWHTATAYLGGSDWYYMDRTTSKVWTTAFFPAYVISLFALGPLFLVAGWFSARSLAHKGAGAFARTRLLRLGVPLIVFIFLIDRLASYLGDLGRRQYPSLADYWGVRPQSGGPYATGVMWFVAALLAFSLAYALLRRVHPAPVARRWSGIQVMVAAAVLIAVTASLVWQRWPPDDASTFLGLKFDKWPQGAGLFALGVWAGEAGSLEDLTAWAPPARLDRPRRRGRVRGRGRIRKGNEGNSSQPCTAWAGRACSGPSCTASSPSPSRCGSPP